MKALTVWQPWATLIAIGAKPHEFRGHVRIPKGTIGSRIAIHAGKRIIAPAEVRLLLGRLRRGDRDTGLVAELAIPYLERVYSDPDTVERGCIVATAILGQPAKAFELPAYAEMFVNDSERDELANYAWPMLDVQRLMPPIEAKGAQGFWNWEAP